MKAFWRNAALLAVSLLPSLLPTPWRCRQNSMAILIAMSRPSPGKPDFARVQTIEIVTNEMNVAQTETTNKADFLTVRWSVARVA